MIFEFKKLAKISKTRSEIQRNGIMNKPSLSLFEYLYVPSMMVNKVGQGGRSQKSSQYLYPIPIYCNENFSGSPQRSQKDAQSVGLGPENTFSMI